MSSGKEIVRTYADAFSRGDIEAVCQLFAPDAQIWGVLGWGSLEQARPIWQDLARCLQSQLHIEDLVQDGSTVVARFSERGQSVEAFRGLGPTHKTYEVLAIEWFELQDDRIQRRWGARDFASISRQLGFL